MLALDFVVVFGCVDVWSSTRNIRPETPWLVRTERCNGFITKQQSDSFTALLQCVCLHRAETCLCVTSVKVSSILIAVN